MTLRTLPDRSPITPQSVSLIAGPMLNAYKTKKHGILTAINFILRLLGKMDSSVCICVHPWLKFLKRHGPAGLHGFQRGVQHAHGVVAGPRIGARRGAGFD